MSRTLLSPESQESCRRACQPPRISPGVDGGERERRPPALREVLPARDPVGGPRGHLGPLGRDVARAHADLRALAHRRQRALAGAAVAPVVVAQHHGDLAALRALPAGQLQHVARDVQGSAPKRPAPYPGGMGEPERPAVGGQRQAVLRLQIEGDRVAPQVLGEAGPRERVQKVDALRRRHPAVLLHVGQPSDVRRRQERRMKLDVRVFLRPAYGPQRRPRVRCLFSSVAVDAGPQSGSAGRIGPRDGQVPVPGVDARQAGHAGQVVRPG